jgi:hypothetical protein
VPAQYAVAQVMALDIGIVEKLRCDHQGVGALPRVGGGIFGAFEVGLGVAQAPMHDDQRPSDLR